MSEVMLCVLEDVLLANVTTPLERHIKMYRGLATQFSQIVVSTWPRHDVEYALHVYNIPFDGIMTKDDSALDDVDWKLSVLRKVAGAMEWPIALYIDGDPGAIRQVLAMGVCSTLLLGHRVQRPSWLPDGSAPREWDRLVSFIDEQKARSAATPPTPSEVHR